MSVLIKGMEMPTGDNNITLFLYPDGKVVVCGMLGPLGYYEAAPVPPHGDLIDRKETIKALWKALFEYEDRTEKQFVESSELDVADWILHRIFVQNMNDIDRKTILQMPTVIPAEPPKEERE